MIPPTKRLNYFDHQFLRVDDFADEQAYHLGMRRAHNRMLHTPGVAQGLAVDHAGSTLTVRAGVALDGDGREIVLKGDAELQVPAELAGTTAYVTLAYAERRTDPTAETGAAGDRRWEEVPVLALAAAAPGHPDTQLVLGRVTIDGARAVVRVDDGEGAARRRVSGPAPGAELSVRALAVQGSAGVTGALRVDGALGIGLGGAAPDAPLHVAGGRGFATTDGDLKVGTGSNRLKVGVEVEGAAAGTARLRAEGAAPRLVLGAGGADVLTVTAGGVNVAPGAPLSVEAAATVGGALTVGGAATVKGALAAGGSSGLVVTAAGKVGIGVASPDALLDVNDRIRLRGVNGNGTTAGVWLRHGAVDRGFVGLVSDDRVGLFGKDAGFAVQMDVATGNVGIRGNPAGSGGAALTVGGDLDVAGTGGVSIRWGEVRSLSVITLRPNTDSIGDTGVRVVHPDGTQLLSLDGDGDLSVRGRVTDARFRRQVTAWNQISITNTVNNWAWNNVPGMEVTLPGAGTYLILFRIGGVEPRNVTSAYADFRIWVDGTTQTDYLADSFNANSWVARSISLECLVTVGAGTHSVVAQWGVRSPSSPTTNPTLWGCWNNDHRTLIAIEL
jgi:hypothetical protein